MEQDIHEAGFEEFNIRSQEALRLTMRTVQNQLAPACGSYNTAARRLRIDKWD